MAAEFYIHIINFRTKYKPDNTFNYKFCLLSVYFVEDVQLILMPTKRKYRPDEMAISPPRMRKTINQANPLHFSVPSLSREKRNL